MIKIACVLRTGGDFSTRWVSALYGALVDLVGGQHLARLGVDELRAAIGIDQRATQQGGRELLADLLALARADRRLPEEDARDVEVSVRAERLADALANLGPWSSPAKEEQRIHAKMHRSLLQRAVMI